MLNASPSRATKLNFLGRMPLPRLSGIRLGVLTDSRVDNPVRAMQEGPCGHVLEWIGGMTRIVRKTTDFAKNGAMVAKCACRDVRLKCTFVLKIKPF
jgi:hypothetical protein